MKRTIVLLGSGGHARSCCDVIELSGKFDIKGFVSNESDLKWSSKYSVLCDDENALTLLPSCQNLLVAVGQLRDYDIRQNIFDYFKSKGFVFPSIISPLAYVAPDVDIGMGTIIMHGAIVNSGATIGENTIINTKALVEHDVRIGNHCHISTGAIINGGSEIDDLSVVGSGALVVNGVKVQRKSFIKMGEIVKLSV